MVVGQQRSIKVPIRIITLNMINKNGDLYKGMVRDSHWTDGAASAYINVMIKNIDTIQPSQRQQVIPRVHPRVLPLARVEVPPNITQLKAFC